MMTHTLLFLCAAACAIAAFTAAIAARYPRRRLRLANIAEGTHEGAVTKLTDAAVTSRYLLAKIGTDVAHVDLCGVSDIPLGVMIDEATAAEEIVAVSLLGPNRKTELMRASAAITLGDMVVAAASGKIRTLPTASGTYYIVGRALQAAAADGDLIEVAPSFPLQRVVA